jgi:hypothetical protein
MEFPGMFVFVLCEDGMRGSWGDMRRNGERMEGDREMEGG